MIYVCVLARKGTFHPFNLKLNSSLRAHLHLHLHLHLFYMCIPNYEILISFILRHVAHHIQLDLNRMEWNEPQATQLDSLIV